MKEKSMVMGLWDIISTTDWVTKVILLVLLGMSVVSWALSFYKKMLISSKIKSLKQAQTLLQNIKGIDDLFARAGVIQDSFAGELVLSFLVDFKKLLKMHETGTGGFSDRDWDLLQDSINQRVDEALIQEEALLPVLQTNAQAAPLIGLFGTVWGLIHAFMGIAQQKSADISAVAPGIAEALITTLGGLVIAIPALVMFNYLTAEVKKLEDEIVKLAGMSVWIMRGIMRNSESTMRPSFVDKQSYAPKEIV